MGRLHRLSQAGKTEGHVLCRCYKNYQDNIVREVGYPNTRIDYTAEETFRIVISVCLSRCH